MSERKLVKEYKQYLYCVDHGDGSSGIRLVNKEKYDAICNSECAYDEFDACMESEDYFVIRTYDNGDVEIVDGSETWLNGELVE